MSRKAPAPRHAGISRPVRRERDRKVGHPDQGQRGDRGLTASSIEPVACPAYPSSISPLISWEKLMPLSVTVARAGKFSLPLSRPSARAWRTAFSISRWAGTPSALSNLRMVGCKVFLFLATLFPSRPGGPPPASPVLACPVVYHLRPPSPALARVALARCPRLTEFVSRRDLRYLLRQVRFGHNLANALDE